MPELPEVETIVNDLKKKSSAEKLSAFGLMRRNL